MTVVVTFLLYMLDQLSLLNLPLIGDYIARSSKSSTPPQSGKP